MASTKKSSVPSSPNSGSSISSVMIEKRRFKPNAAFAKLAHVGSERELNALVKKAERDPVKFWETQARELRWMKPWKKALVWNAPYAQWFVGGELNISDNCLDRHVENGRGNKAAIIWESEPGEVRTLTYRQLLSEVSRFANSLKALGVKKGDVVGIYMGMVPEAAIAMLACSRIGATHNVVFGGFSAEALRERLRDSKAVCLVTQDVAMRRGNAGSLKASVDEALEDPLNVKNVVVFKRGAGPVNMVAGRDHYWSDLTEKASDRCAPAALPAEHPLFILYTSGSTGKPKGILHTTGGYLTQVAYTTKYIFDLRDDDIYFCSADVGWVTGHSYITYGPLTNGATIFMYEGVPNHPGPDRFWRMIDRHRVTIFYTAPTAIRSFIKAGDDLPKRHDLSSLRLLGSVGEPINPEAWMWYHRVIGGGRCPIVDTWWQTETGGAMISPIPGATTTKPGTATRPIPGILAEVVRKDGVPCKKNEGGFLVIKHPWPSMLRTVYGDNERYEKTYWSEFPPVKMGKGPSTPAELKATASGKLKPGMPGFAGYYFAGDGARRDDDGYFWIMGRVDDVVNVSGHRLGTAEVESALVAHKMVAEAAVVARPDDLKGSALVAFVTLKAGATAAGDDLNALKEALRAHVGREIGPIAKPDEIRFSEGLPKTRSGKIMRRLLREIAAGMKVSGDTSTLEDFSVLEKLRAGDDE